MTRENSGSATKIEDNRNHFFPERQAGGFSRVDSAIEFYTRVNALLKPDMRVLDLGAGRGAQLLDTRSKYRTNLLTIRGKVAHLAGVDVDPVVLENPFLDEAKVINYRAPIPFPDESFDLIFADWVLEHVDNPEDFEANIYRLLKPGGWFLARTPNRWGITGLATNIIPNKLHTRVLMNVQPGRPSQDVFPTRYKINTRGRVRRYFPTSRYNDYSYITNAEPPYMSISRTLMRMVFIYWRMVPRLFYTNLFVIVQRK